MVFSSADHVTPFGGDLWWGFTVPLRHRDRHRASVFGRWQVTVAVLAGNMLAPKKERGLPALKGGLG